MYKFIRDCAVGRTENGATKSSKRTSGCLLQRKLLYFGIGLFGVNWTTQLQDFLGFQENVPFYFLIIFLLVVVTQCVHCVELGLLRKYT